MQEEEDYLEIEDIGSDQYTTLRMKKLFSTLVAEFRPIVIGAQLLDEEELKQFKSSNIKDDRIHLKHQFDFDNQEEQINKKNNLKLLGLNGEDIRQWCIYHYQTQLQAL